LVTSSIAIVFGGLLACGLGIVPFARRQKWFIGGAAAIGAIAGVVALPLEVGYTAGRSLDVIFDESAWRAVFDTTIGLAWVVRAAAIALSQPFCCGPPRTVASGGGKRHSAQVL
jgi:putative copper export protein